MKLSVLLHVTATAALGLALLPAAHGFIAASANPVNLTFNTGTFFSSTNLDGSGNPYKFSGKLDPTGLNYYLLFQFTGPQGSTLYGHNLTFTDGSGKWIANPSASTSNGTRGLDANGPTVLLNAGQFFQVPIIQYGDNFAFDLTETGAQFGTASTLTMSAKDDLVTLATINFTPSGPATAVSYTSQQTVTVAPTPEPSPASVMALGVFSIAGLRAVRRRSIA